jgi:hypothetical protein
MIHELYDNGRNKFKNSDFPFLEFEHKKSPNFH